MIVHEQMFFSTAVEKLRQNYDIIFLVDPNSESKVF